MNRGINLSAALKNASENVFGVEAEVDIGTQGHIGANTCVIPSLFAGIAEVARCRMACGREGIIALELAECVSEDIRRAFLFCRAQREGAAGTKTDSANDAVGVCNLSFDAAVRFELVAFNADDLELSLRFDEEVRQGHARSLEQSDGRCDGVELLSAECHYRHEGRSALVHAR